MGFHRTTARTLTATIVTSASLLTFVSLTLVSGCRKQEEAPPPQPTPVPRVSEEDMQKYKPNEAGAIMILMYHDFDPKRPNADLNRKPDQFRADLQSLYANRYYPVTVSELIENHLDVPVGKIPVVLTFDDAKPTQFRIVTGSDGQPHIDRNCAVGMLETFHKQHPDWPLKATFFVLPKEGLKGTEPFGQMDYVQEKFGYLVEKGYEIANHTSTHSSLRRLAVDKIRWELATAKRDIQQIAPKATMQVLALPYGDVPRQPDAVKALISGTHGGITYQHKAVLRAAWRPVLSPITRNDPKLSNQDRCAFDPYRLERITPNPRKKDTPGTFEYWVRWFNKNPRQRYISDGKPNIVTVPESLKTMVDEARVKAQGKTLQYYGATSSKGKGGGSLSVE